MSGKVLALIMAVVAVATAVGVYYLQVYHYYEEVAPDGFALVTESGEIDAQATNIEAIDAISSPIRFRACFDTALTPAADATRYEDAVPLTAPFWFDCFDATQIGDALEAGTATAFLAEKNVEYGVDRIVAITDDGRGYVWHQLNNCGETAYDGTQIGEDCPPREDQ
ncbi:hypothetical protein PARPLA_00976 [Rhodobacteraceae bacterium THAF1]|uniref:DUF6446 family protein n=1 Tax=Palleronia sp. THAF1 TaxID=2587842 RepID=UPI000F401945|nr:DUF6446 family protein [Palleronia sp. THAF1]QFU07512.1 hypothetical protein FIU81_02355 [Palleronia sp. THAF1]VDC20475.1 hypothetical protein PARPLA_00976 [Rhodobacteraceae bacterium THAF1]